MFLFIIALILVMIAPRTYKEDIAIKYGEFLFKLEYEIAGEKKTIEDIWTIKYDSTTRHFDIGEYINWEVNLKSGRKKIILCEKDNIKIYCEPYGVPNYYMGGYGYEENLVPDFPEIYEITYGEGSNIGNDEFKILDEYELLSKYKFKWIGAEYPDPIVNDFGEDK